MLYQSWPVRHDPSFRPVGGGCGTVRPAEVELRANVTGQTTVLPNDWVLALIGYLPDASLLTGMGVEINAETGVPAHDAETLETNVPGVFVAGVIAAGYDANKNFIENGKHHGPAIVAAITGCSRV